MEKALRSKKAICFFILPGLILFLLIVAIPIIQSADYSLLKWNGISEGTFVGLDNYIEMFKDPVFLLSLKNSLLLAAASVLIQMPISMLLALVLVN